jgi:hypothetical protein
LLITSQVCYAAPQETGKPVETGLGERQQGLEGGVHALFSVSLSTMALINTASLLEY